MTEQKWPQRLWIVRHGQSAGNVARDAAEAAGLPLIDVAYRDVDTPLSALGERQAQSLAHWFGRLPTPEQPTVIMSSPYLRAVQTAQTVVTAGGLHHLRLIKDERLREKEFGILDRLTRRGIEEKYPELSEQRAHVGKFYFRPPGGESWCDVILRLRQVLETVTREYARENVLIVGHQVIVNCFRYLLERMDEEGILAVDQQGDVPNCGLTHYEFDPHVGRRGKLCLRQANFVAPLQEEGTPVTAKPDVPVAPKA
ncbi:MAG: histidine phosphatase family protein [Rubrivivax sp.]|nr:MAG: histidine phosphatase family protein [Rubrivivax sp.]